MWTLEKKGFKQLSVSEELLAIISMSDWLTTILLCTYVFFSPGPCLQGIQSNALHPFGRTRVSSIRKYVFGEEEILAELLSELGPKDAVDEEVGRWVDDQEYVGKESTNDNPNRKSSKKRILAKFNEIKNEDHMHVEDQTREITEDECGNNNDEDDRQVFILHSSCIPPPPNSKVDADVEEGDGHEWKDPNDQQA